MLPGHLLFLDFFSFSDLLPRCSIHVPHLDLVFHLRLPLLKQKDDIVTALSVLGMSQEASPTDFGSDSAKKCLRSLRQALTQNYI